MRTFLRFVFYLLYHPFAFTYDLVAATVSLGRWKDWVLSVVPFIKGTRILEIGHGPGHLQRVLLSRGVLAVGIDASPQMGRLAKRNLMRYFATTVPLSTRQSQLVAYAKMNLARGLAQHLPFPNDSFDTVVATFPAEYIFHADTLNEARRVLVHGGRFVILPGATILGRSNMDRLMAWIFHITGQSAPNLGEILKARASKPFAQAGFHMQVHELNIKSSLVFIIVATKQPPSLRGREPEAISS